MKTPKTVSKLSLIATCVGISIFEINSYMEGTTKAKGVYIRKLIEEHLPDLYKELNLKYPNPFEDQCMKKEGLLIYVHDGIDYFLEYEE